MKPRFKAGGAKSAAGRNRGAYPRMQALVRIALQRPYTFVVMALLILIVGPLAALRTPTDIFPNVNIPVIAVVWT
jgi:hypothetical protein